MFRKLIGVSVGLLVSGLAGTASAGIIKNYAYSGNNFDSIVEGAQFSTADSISGFFTVDCALLGGSGDCKNLSSKTISGPSIPPELLEFSFQSSGSPNEVVTSAEASACCNFTITIDTDASMNITSWFVLVFDEVTDIRISSSLLASSDGASFYDQVKGFGLPPDFLLAERAENESNPGSWTFTTIDVPEPSTLASFSLGLIGLIFFTRRRKAI